MAKNRIATPKWYKRGGVNRFRIGLWDAFGKGLEEDNGGNIIFDYLEVQGFRENTEAYQLDWTKYGKTDVTSLEERRFEEIQDYWDANGNPDYVTFVDRLDEMKSVIYGEIVSIIEVETSGEITVSVEQEPLIINDTEIFQLEILSVDGNRYIISQSAIYFENYCDNSIDRLQCLKKRTFKINLAYAGLTLEPGDILVCTYTYFHHTDMVRDANEYSQWESGYTPDTLIEIELLSETDQKIAVNNIELKTIRKNYPTGAKEYILQAVEESYGAATYKVIKAGYLGTSKNGDIDVIKFDLRYVKKLRLILMGTTGRSFIEANILISDPNLINYYKKFPTVPTLELEDFYKVSIIPFYNNPSRPNDSFIQGETITPADMTSWNGVALYIPYFYNGANELYQNYVLTYFDVYYGGTLVYKGIPNAFLSTENYLLDYFNLRDYEFGVCTDTDFEANIYHIFDRDILTSSAAGNESIFYTRFPNIVGGKFVLYKNDTLMTSGYSIDYDKGIITLEEALSPGDSLYAKYVYKVKKLGSEGIYDYVDLLRIFGWREAIRYSSIKIFPEQYFLEYLPNNSSQVMEFEVNPSQWNEQIESNQILTKTLGGTYRKQKFGTSKSKFTIKGEKISDEMFEKLRSWEQETTVLGLVDDMLKIHKGYIVPGSLTGDRRKTTREEQENETTSWTWSLTFQEV